MWAEALRVAVNRKPKAIHCIGEMKWQVCSAWLDIHGAVMHKLAADPFKLTRTQEIFEEARQEAHYTCRTCAYTSTNWQREVTQMVDGIPKFSRILFPGLS
jgi:hypothetical protein